MKSILFTYFPAFVLWSHACSLLTAICKEAGINADYEPLWPGFFERMLEYDVIGFSFVCDADYQMSLPYLRAAQAAGKEVIAGGVYARRGGYIDPELVDLVCRGEAEPIVGYLKDGDLSIFKEKYYQKSIDGLPMPDLSHYTTYELHRGYPFLQGVRIVPYQSSRGCCSPCAFCEVRYQPKGLRMKHTIAADMVALNEKYHPNLFWFAEELPPYYSDEWRDQMKDIFFPFMCYIRADIEPEHLEFMIAHGMKVACFGIESGDEQFRNEVLRKNLMDYQIMRTVNTLKKNNILYLPFYMNGVPGETKEIVQKTLDMMQTVGGYPTLWKYQDLRITGA